MARKIKVRKHTRDGSPVKSHERTIGSNRKVPDRRTGNKVENKISEILKKLRDKNVSQDSIDVIRYELHGHGIPNAIDNDNFSYKIGNNYLSITYFYEQKSNFFQNEWVRDSRYYFEREELPEDNK